MMDNIKDKITLLPIVNTVAILGVTSYYYKQIEYLKTEVNKTNKTVTELVNKIRDVDKGQRENIELVHSVERKLEKLSKKLESFPPPHILNRIDSDIDSIVDTLSENNMKISNRSRRNGRIRYDEEYEDRQRMFNDDRSFSREYHSDRDYRNDRYDRNERQDRQDRVYSSNLMENNREENDLDQIISIMKGK